MPSSSRRLSIDTEGFSNVIKRLNDLEANVPKVVEKALKDTHAYVTPNIHAAMKKHNKTGKTERSIADNPRVEWVGSVASIDIGFDISNGGLPSIFLMYGTKVHGTPRTLKDQILFNSIYGSAVSKKAYEIQQDAFYAEIRRLNG